MCMNGTMEKHENGLAFRGVIGGINCPNYDDVCCRPDLEKIETAAKAIKIPKIPETVEKH